MKHIILQTIPHAEQPYSSLGDWDMTLDGQHLTINASDLGDWRYNLLIQFHELVEVALCRQRGITQRQVEDFDKKFEALPKPDNNDEPGHDPKAPYHKEHVFAECLERLLAAQLGVNWQEYEAAADALPAWVPQPIKYEHGTE